MHSVIRPDGQLNQADGQRHGLSILLLTEQTQSPIEGRAAYSYNRLTGVRQVLHGRLRGIVRCASRNCNIDTVMLEESTIWSAATVGVTAKKHSGHHIGSLSL